MTSSNNNLSNPLDIALAQFVTSANQRFERLDDSLNQFVQISSRRFENLETQSQQNSQLIGSLGDKIDTFVTATAERDQRYEDKFTKLTERIESLTIVLDNVGSSVDRLTQSIYVQQGELRGDIMGFQMEIEKMNEIARMQAESIRMMIQQQNKQDS